MSMVKYYLWLNTKKAVNAYEEAQKVNLKGRERVVSRLLEGRAYDEKVLGKLDVLPCPVQLLFNRHLEKLLRDSVRNGYVKLGCVEGKDFELLKAEVLLSGLGIS